MNLRLAIAALAFAAAPAAAQDPAPMLPPVQAEAVRHVVDCERRNLPSQRDVGEWTGQHNFSQVYDTRQRLMAEIGRNCRRPGTGQVQVVARMSSVQGALRLVALAEHRGR